MNRYDKKSTLTLSVYQVTMMKADPLLVEVPNQFGVEIAGSSPKGIPIFHTGQSLKEVLDSAFILYGRIYNLAFTLKTPNDYLSADILYKKEDLTDEQRTEFEKLLVGHHETLRKVERKKH